MNICSSRCEYHDEHREEAIWGRLCFLTLCMASLVRIYFYIFPKDLWLDEALIAVAIDRASWSEIFRGQLINIQSCPIFFAVYNKFLNIYTDYSPHVLYFTPMLAGIFLLILLIKLCKYYEESNLLALICVILAASCKFALYYSLEFKQYIIEGCVSVILLMIFVCDIKKEKFAELVVSYKYPILFSVSILASSPSIFVSAGISFSILVYLLINQKLKFYKTAKILLSRYIVFAAVCILYYLLYLRNEKTLQAMYEGWKPYFIPLDLTLWPDYFTNVVLANWGGMFSLSSPYSWQSGIFAVLIFFSFVLGCYFLFKRNKYEFIACFFPFMFATIAAFRFYPPGAGGFGGVRLSLYLFPVIIFISSVGLYNFSIKLLKHNHIILKCVLILGCFFALCTNIEYVYSSVIEKQQTFSLFDKIHKEKNNNDYVLVFSSTEPALEYWEIVNNKNIEYDIISRDLFRERNVDIENIESCLSEGFLLHDKIFVVYSHRYYEKASNIMKEIFTRHGYKVETKNAKGAILQKAVRIS